MPEPIKATFQDKLIAAMGPFSSWLPFFAWEAEFIRAVLPVIREEIREPTDPAAQAIIDQLKNASSVDIAVAVLNQWIEKQELGRE